MTDLTDSDAACIDACQQCAAACLHCATECLQEEGAGTLARCIALDNDCAALCTAAAHAVASGGEFATAICGLCARACDSCAEECARHPLVHCQDCAAACRACAAECRHRAARAVQAGAAARQGEVLAG